MRFPTDTALADRFGVSKMTVRKALDDLVEAGLLYRQRGSGTFVTDHAYEEHLSPTLDVDRHYNEAGDTQSVRVLGFTERAATGEEAEILGAPRVVSLLRMRAVRGVPLALDERILPAALAQAAGLTAGTATGNIADRLRAAVPLSTARWKMRALPADRDTALHLCLREGDPVLERAMTYLTNDGRPILTGRTVQRGDIVSCSVEIPLDVGEEA